MAEKSISLLKLLSLNVKDIEKLFGKKRLREILEIVQKHEKIIEMNSINEKLHRLEESKKELLENLNETRIEMESINIAYSEEI